MGTDSSTETIQPTRNILDCLETLLGPQNEWEVKEIYQRMLNNGYVKREGLRPSLEQFRHYFELVKKGFEYLRNTYGNRTLPREIYVFSELVKVGNKKDADWIGYMATKDQMGVSLLHIAGQCSYYGELSYFFSDPHLGSEDEYVRGEDYTVLQAIEEGYHRYQLRALGMKPGKGARDMNDPLEAGIIPVFKRAVRDLGIRIYLLGESIEI